LWPVKALSLWVKKLDSKVVDTVKAKDRVMLIVLASLRIQTMVKSRSADVQICGCRNKLKAKVKHRVIIRVEIRVRDTVRIRNRVMRWLN